MENQNKKIVKTKFTIGQWIVVLACIYCTGYALWAFTQKDISRIAIIQLLIWAFMGFCMAVMNRKVVSTSIGTRAEIKKTEVDTDSRYQKTQDDKDLFCSNYNIAHRIFHNISYVVFENKGCISYFRTEEGEYSCINPEVTPNPEILQNH